MIFARPSCAGSRPSAVSSGTRSGCSRRSTPNSCVPPETGHPSSTSGMLGAIMSEMGFPAAADGGGRIARVLPGIMAHVIEEIVSKDRWHAVRDRDNDCLRYRRASIHQNHEERNLSKQDRIKGITCASGSPAAGQDHLEALRDAGSHRPVYQPLRRRRSDAEMEHTRQGDDLDHHHGAFFSKRANPQPADYGRRDTRLGRGVHQAGAPNIHIHVRDDGGFNALDPQRFHDVIAPLRKNTPKSCSTAAWWP